jgi:hypothetical protein
LGGQIEDRWRIGLFPAEHVAEGKAAVFAAQTILLIHARKAFPKLDRNPLTHGTGAIAAMGPSVQSRMGEEVTGYEADRHRC